MKLQENGFTRKVCFWAGVCLLLAAIIVLILWQWAIYTAEQKTAEYVNIIRELIPDPQGAVPDERSNNAMPILSVEETDFVGIIEMPRYGSVLPVCATWGSLSQYPCCFSGNIHNRTMQIGGTSQMGQYDFYREISVGDAVFFTDMEGNRYTYAVTDLHYAKNANQTTLRRKNAALTLFIKNIYAFEYLIVFCDVMH